MNDEVVLLSNESFYVRKATGGWKQIVDVIAAGASGIEPAWHRSTGGKGLLSVYFTVVAINNDPTVFILS